jgi:hypothetical protein
MNSQVNPQPHKLGENSPYCADPNCVSGKQLREMHERIRAGKLPVPPSRCA